MPILSTIRPAKGAKTIEAKIGMLVIPGAVVNIWKQIEEDLVHEAAAAGLDVRDSPFRRDQVGGESGKWKNGGIECEAQEGHIPIRIGESPYVGEHDLISRTLFFHPKDDFPPAVHCVGYKIAQKRENAQEAGDPQSRAEIAVIARNQGFRVERKQRTQAADRQRDSK